MTKTLTEQWRKHNLKYKQHYYLRTKDGGEDIQPFMGGFFMSESNEVKEVLAPVPGYDKVKEMSQKIERLEFDNEALEMAHNEGKEINAELVSKTDKLEKRLEIAKKALKKIIRDYEINGIGYLCVTRAKEALKEMEGVK